MAITTAVLNGVQNFLSQQVLSQGQFIITNQERNAYINNIPTAQLQPQTLIQPQTPVIIPNVQAVQPTIIEETIESEEQTVQAPQPFVSTGSSSSSGGGGGY